MTQELTVPAEATGDGSVTSVGLTVPTEFSVSGSPVTTTGTLAVAKANQTANTVWAGPGSGAAAAPAFRTLVTADLPAGVGTVTSVGMTMPGIMTVSGSPVTTTGTLAATLSTQAANLVFAAPSGASGIPTFRSLTTADLPTLNQGTVTSVGLSTPSILTVSGSPITSAGTIATTLTTQAAGNLLFASPSGVSGIPSFRTMVVGDIPNDLITYAKLQNVSATDKVLGRSTAGSGDVEEIACTAAGRALLDDADAAAQRTTLSVREQLTAARTYYVRTDGSDSNTGLVNSAGGAFLTIQKAVDVINATLDTAGFVVTISVGAGTFTTAVVLKPIVGGGSVALTGAGIASTIISVTGDHAILAVGVIGDWTISAIKIQTTTSGTGLFVRDQAVVSLGAMAFGAVAGTAHVQVSNNAVVNFNASYTINGSAAYHVFCSNAATVSCLSGITVTVSGTPAFSGEFVRSDRGALVQLSGITFSGSATGQRYAVELNSVLYTNGGGAGYFPGNSAGSSATGGQYA